uniref:Uncharacterized protein n=1 Tax=Solanum lycopersicum TaxID=4081 RepID=K4CC02_SOLLC
MWLAFLPVCLLSLDGIYQYPSSSLACVLHLRLPDVSLIPLPQSGPREATLLFCRSSRFPSTRYAILGDDSVIGDERVAERYCELIPPLNVPFSLEKSLVSSVSALEFAKRFFLRGVTKDFFPISCRMLRSLVSSISFFL